MTSSVISALRCDAVIPFSLRDYYRHSTTVASVAEKMAKHISRTHAIEIDDVYTAGMLHDIGKLALCSFDSRIVGSAMTRSVTEELPYYEAEDAVLSHTRAGALLAEHWNFPPNLAACFAYHHAPGETPEARNLVAITHIADIVTHMIGYHTIEKEATPEINETAMALVGLPPERLRTIAHEMLRERGT
jgi:putative nucleotidyltransferase with HDIG domain